MQITDPQGQSLSDEEMALFDAHPNLLRLAVKACRIERDPTIPPPFRQRVYQAWAMRLLDLGELRWQALAKRNQADRDESN